MEIPGEPEGCLELECVCVCVCAHAHVLCDGVCMHVIYVCMCDVCSGVCVGGSV